MDIIVKETVGERLDPVPEGVHVAVCYGVIDIGTHENKIYGRESHDVLLLWEFPECRGEFERDGEKVDLPRVISRRYKLSLNEKANLRKHLEGWRGRGFSVEELNGFGLRALLGKACQLQIIHKTAGDGHTYAHVAAVMALPKGTPRPSKPENEPVFFTFREEGNKPEIPAGLPDWIQRLIRESKEWDLRGFGKAVDEAQADDLSDDDQSEEEEEEEEDNLPF